MCLKAFVLLEVLNCGNMLGRRTVMDKMNLFTELSEDDKIRQADKEKFIQYSIGKRDSVDYGTATLISSLDSARYKILMDKDALMDGKDDSKREAVLSVLSDVQHLLQGEDVTLGYKARFYELNMKAALDYLRNAK